MAVTRELTGGVLMLTLNRADKKNALTGAMYAALTAGLAEAEGDPGIAAVLIAGEGDAFCAGNDINDFLQAERGTAAMTFIRAIARFGKPVVAAVQGLAVGVGTTMLLHCDLVYAAPNARFTVPFTRLGLVPEAGSSLLLPRRIGEARAAAMLMLGEPLDAAGAAAAGLVTALVPAAELRDTARAKAAALAALPPAALAETRRLMRGDRVALDAALAAEEQAFAAALAGPEAREALTAFVEKRAPDFARVRAA